MTPSLITKEHNGLAFTFRDDGWFNMTKAATHFGKDVRDFMYAESTQAYAEELSKCGKYPQLKEAKKGRYGGTWAHPKLAVFFARWLDVRFAVWCDASSGYTYPPPSRPLKPSPCPPVRSRS
jgi:hypothetical protein